MILKIDFKKLLISLLIPLGVGALSALITSGEMDAYSKVNQPPLSPPGIVFPIVWIILYTLMGISLYLIWSNKEVSGEEKRNAYIFFALQLILNFIWSPIFFNAKEYLIAFVVLVLLWISAIIMTVLFYRISKPAGLLQIPYLIWLTFAAYLNFGVYYLNR